MGEKLPPHMICSWLYSRYGCIADNMDANSFDGYVVNRLPVKLSLLAFDKFFP